MTILSIQCHLQNQEDAAVLAKKLDNFLSLLAAMPDPTSVTEQLRDDLAR